MDVDRTIYVRTAAQNTAMEGETGSVDSGALIQIVVHADFDEVRCGDLRVEQFMALDQKVSRVGGYTHGGVIEDDIAPAVMREQPIDRSQIKPGLCVCVGMNWRRGIHSCGPSRR